MNERLPISRGELLWEPDADRIKASQMHAFMARLNEQFGSSFDDYQSLYRFSIDEPIVFWRALWEFLPIIGDGPGDEVVRDIHLLPGAQWFPEARINFAENLLRYRGDSEALICFGEDGSRHALSREELYLSVARLASAMRAAGLGPGDRVAAYLPNVNAAVVGALATASLGASWAITSTEWAVPAVLDRLEQVQPRFLFVADQSEWKGKRNDASRNAAEIVASLPSIEKVIIVPFEGIEPRLAVAIPKSVSLSEFTEPYQNVTSIEYARLPFAHPLFILFTSGTSGRPKCIVHGHGSVLIQFMKEHQLHWDMRPGDRVFRATSAGWMIWQHTMAALASGATVLNYGGSPFFPGESRLFDMAQDEQVSIFGIPSMMLDTCMKAKLSPRETHDLSSLKCFLASGSPLAPEHYQYVYDEIKCDVHFASPTGGTDLAAAFASGNPIGPTRAGETQVFALGMKVEIFDEEGKGILGRSGELVCTQPFPSVPIAFLNDPGDARFLESYFEKYSNVWHHGDWAEATPHGGLVISGRSDATLNAKGVRIGTAEIYRYIAQMPEIVNCVAVAQEWRDDTRVVLFVQLAKGMILNDGLRSAIQQGLRQNASPRHVPERIVQVADIPSTATGKASELAVRDAIHGRPVKNASSLANPDALGLFQGLAELAI